MSPILAIYHLVRKLPMDDVREQAREIYHNVRLLKSCLSRRYAYLREEGKLDLFNDLTMPQCNAMEVIRCHPGLTIKELADQLHVSAPSASAMVDRLVDMGMVQRVQSQVDRREVHVRVAPFGEQCLRAFEEQMLQTLVELLEKVGPETGRKWFEVYQKLGQVIQEEENIQIC